MMGTRSLPASIQPSSDWSRGWPGSDWAMLVPMHTGLVDLHSSFARSRRSRNGVGFDLSGVHWALVPGGRHGATVDTENADTEELPRTVCDSTSLPYGRYVIPMRIRLRATSSRTTGPPA